MQMSGEINWQRNQRVNDSRIHSEKIRYWKKIRLLVRVGKQMDLITLRTKTKNYMPLR